VRLASRFLYAIRDRAPVGRVVLGKREREAGCCRSALGALDQLSLVSVFCARVIRLLRGVSSSMFDSSLKGGDDVNVG